MKKLQLIIQVPEDYEDVCAELLVEDLHIHPDFVIEDYCFLDSIEPVFRECAGE